MEGLWRITWVGSACPGICLGPAKLGLELPRSVPVLTRRGDRKPPGMFSPRLLPHWLRMLISNDSPPKNVSIWLTETPLMLKSFQREPDGEEESS